MSLKLTGNGLFESSRMMLPEHKEAYNMYRRGLARKERPELDEQEIERMSFLLNEALHEASLVRITLFDPYQQREQIGKVVQLDSNLCRVKLAMDDECYWLSWTEIVGIATL